MWKTLKDDKIPDIVEWIKNNCKEGQAVHIGTDSLQTGRYTQYVTVVAILTPTKGGRAAYSREVTKRVHSLRERLLAEVWRSVDLGLKLTSFVPGDLTVHIDANPSPIHKSSLYIQELVGAVVSQGFKHEIKPNAWCASHAADHIVRFKGRLPKAS